MTQPLISTPVVAAAPLVIPTPSVSLVGHAEALQTILADLGTVTVAQLVQLFRQYHTAPDFPAVLHAAFPEIVRPHAEAAAQITAQWFNDIVPGTDAQPVVDLAPERVTKTVDWALHAPTAKTPTETPKAPSTSDGTPSPEFHAPAKTPEAPHATAPETSSPDSTPVDLHAPAKAPEPGKSPPTPDETLSRLSGASKRMVMDASRRTVLANARIQGLRWARQAQPDACAFCRLLATRSDEQLYRSEGIKFDKELDDYITVVVGRRGKPRGSRNLGDKYHDHCRCVAVPIPQGGTYEPPDYVAQWQEDYEKARNDVANSGDGMSVRNILSKMRGNTNAR